MDDATKVLLVILVVIVLGIVGFTIATLTTASTTGAVTQAPSGLTQTAAPIARSIGSGCGF